MIHSGQLPGFSGGIWLDCDEADSVGIGCGGVVDGESCGFGFAGLVCCGEIGACCGVATVGVARRPGPRIVNLRLVFRNFVPPSFALYSVAPARLTLRNRAWRRFARVKSACE